MLLAGLLFFMPISQVQASKGDMPLVISEIQKSVEKKFGVVFPEQNPMPRPVEEKKAPENKVEEKKELNEAPKKVVQRREARGLIEDDSSPSPAPIKNKKNPLIKPLKKPKKSGLSLKERMAQKREENKRKREALLAKKREEKAKSLKEKVYDNRSADKANSGYGGDDWMRGKQAAADNWSEKRKKQTNKWQADRLATIKKWEEARAQFKKDLPKIKADLTDIPFGASSVGKMPKRSRSESQVRTNPDVMVASTSGSGAPLELSFIEEAFRIPIRSQGTRPTCAAFAAVRAVEILAKAMGKERDLSEQYFYYASKPDCQRSPCQKPGSWPRLAFVNSQNSSSFDIPPEKACPYNDKKKAGNETQIPMKNSCQQGVAKVKKFTMVKSRSEIHQRLRAGQPIVGGFRLSDDFFLNTGYVFKESGQKVGKREHAQGHAILLVGVMELPKSLHRTQGRYCTLIANSWGEGWGRGGHACISDSWFDEFRYDIPFIALEQVAVR